MNIPSSFFSKEALLHKEPISNAFSIAGETIPEYGTVDVGSRKTVSSTAYNSVTVCSFLVSVPVLSEQMTETDPRASTECSFFTIAFRFAMRNTPKANVTVVTIGRPSGMAATASDTDRKHLAISIPNILHE